MRATQRLRKLEQSKGGGVFVGLLEDREGCERTECGTTHAPVKDKTFARSDYPTDGAFWFAVEARIDKLGVTPVWITADMNEI